MVGSAGATADTGRTQVAPWQVGLVIGSTLAALSLRPSGLQRGPLAQALLSGSSFALGMGVGIGLNKGVKAIAQETGVTENTVRGAALGIGAVAMAAGRFGKSHPYPFAATVDSVGRATAAAALGGFAVDTHHRVADALHERLDDVPHELVSGAMAGVEASALVGYLLWRRRANAVHDLTTPSARAVLAATGTVGGGVLAVGGGQTLAERHEFSVGDNAAVKRGAMLAGVTALGAGALFGVRAMRKGGAAVPYVPRLTTSVESVSGRAGSLVDLSVLPPSAVSFLNEATPASKIQQVLGEAAVDPIRVAVGLKNAPTGAARAELGLRELDRLGAFGNEARSPVKYIFVTVPPGAGNLDPPLASSAEFMARGDIASIALHYSDRASALSLNRIQDGADTYEHLFRGIRERLDALPEEQRPKVLVYGNSLGAWVSQETARNKGVAGMPAIDRALWVGTPGPSGWYRQMMYSTDEAFAADRELVHQFGTVDELRQFAATPAAEAKRFFLHTRPSDPVPKLDVDMLWRRPLWLREEYRPVSGAPRHSVYTPGVTFLQELTDTAITATIADDPGRATIGHTYHTDIIPDVRHALFPGSISDAQEQAITRSIHP